MTPFIRYIVGDKMFEDIKFYRFAVMFTICVLLFFPLTFVRTMELLSYVAMAALVCAIFFVFFLVVNAIVELDFDGCKIKKNKLTKSIKTIKIKQNKRNQNN